MVLASGFISATLLPRPSVSSIGRIHQTNGPSNPRSTFSFPGMHRPVQMLGGLTRQASQGPESFEPFDGSLPLLPQWRPASPEEDFTYHGARARARENAAANAKPIVAVVVTPEDGHQQTLFAELLQTGLKGGRAWLRPLLMHNGTLTDQETDSGRKKSGVESSVEGEGDVWLDMRATSDIFLPEHLLQAPTDKQKVLVAMSIAASEQDLLYRCIESNECFENNRYILGRFVGMLDIRDP